MKKLIWGIGLLLPLLAGAQGTGDSWKPLQFIMGEWSGGGSGKPGEGSGEFSLKPDLDNKILVRRNHNEYPPKAGQAKAAVHDDLMIIYPAKGASPYRAEYFDSEGHVIRYAISFSEGKAVFLSDGPASDTRYRLTYQKKGDTGLQIDFAIAPPNQDFRNYLSGSVTRK
jgi:hypothetical protein